MMMKQLSSRDEEFFSRFERFKTRLRELRGLRVNQFLGLLDKTQLRKVALIERDIEDFIRKYAYNPRISAAMQENILVLYNSDVVMRRRIDQRGSSTAPGGPFVVPAQTRQGAGREAGDAPERGATGKPGVPPPDDGNGETPVRSTEFFTPTAAAVARKASELMGGRRISGASLDKLQQAIARKLQGNGGKSPSAQGVHPGRKDVKLALTASGKVSIQVSD